jgi:dockerin type I repeat protein
VPQRNPYMDCLRPLVLMALFSFVPQVAALEWGPVGGPDYYDPARHNPFAQDPDFIAPTLDLSGVGQFHKVLTNNYFWVTMISDTYFVTARHILGGFEDYDVHFYHDNDPTPAESIPIDDTYLAVIGANSNLLIGRLTSAPSSAVKRYPLIKRPEGTNYAGIDDIDLELYLVGARGATLEYGEAQSRVGLNDISQHYGEHLYFTYDFGQRGVDEARTLCCDSSAPSFVANHYGNFAVAGIHEDNSDISISPLASAIAAEVYNSSGGAESVTIVSDLAGDLNADFKVDLNDREILLNNLGNGPGMRHINGDINGDGYVNNDDLMAMELNFNKTLLAPADFNADFAVDKLDMLVIGNHWHSAVTAYTNGDANGDGYVDGPDFDLLNAGYLNVPWTAPHAVSPVPGDLTEDGLVDNDDSNILLSCITSVCSPQDFDRSDINNDGFVDGSDLQIMVMNWDPTGPADVNNDLKINNDDISVLFRNWATRTNIGKADGDLNLDGVVGVDDYAIMTNWWGRGVSDFAAQAPIGPIPLPGDFNADGTVNAADYVVWRKGIGSTYTQAAYDVWRTHFGQTAGSGSALPSAASLSAAVPEPSALVPLIFAAAGWCLRRNWAA